MNGVSEPGGIVLVGISLLISISQAADWDPLPSPHCYSMCPPCSFLHPALSTYNLSLRADLEVAFIKHGCPGFRALFRYVKQ